MQKLAQMGVRVFGISSKQWAILWEIEGTVPEIAMQTVEKIEDFYENVMGVPTHICQYKVNQNRDWIGEVVKKFKENSVILGENKRITPEIVGRLIEDSY